MERPRRTPSFRERETARRKALRLGLDVVSANQGSLAPHESLLLRRNLLAAFVGGGITDLVNSSIAPEAIVRVIEEERIPQDTSIKEINRKED